MEELLQLWLETKPDTNEKRALATALKLAEIGVRNELPISVCRSMKSLSQAASKTAYILEGADKQYYEMLMILNEAAKNKHKAREILKPWQRELEAIKEDLEAYLELYSP